MVGHARAGAQVEAPHLVPLLQGQQPVQEAHAPLAPSGAGPGQEGQQDALHQELAGGEVGHRGRQGPGSPAPGVLGGEPGEGLAQQLVARLTPLHQGPGDAPAGALGVDQAGCSGRRCS